MKTRPKLRLFRYLLPVVIVLALIFSVRYCGKQENLGGIHVIMQPSPKKVSCV